MNTFSVSMGNGSLVFGLAAVIIGERILNPKTIEKAILRYFIGSLVYKAMLEFASFNRVPSTNYIK